MGYDMRIVGDPSQEEKDAIKAADEAFRAAIQIRNALPKTESGRFRGRDVLEAEGIDWDDHRAYKGRTQRFVEAQDAVVAASYAMDKADASYFRLNGGSMGVFAALMYRLGMLQEGHKHPEWPESEDYGLNDDIDWDAVYEVKASLIKGDTGDTLPVDPKILSYAQATVRVLGWIPEKVTGIQGFKFGSNDGWVVTPREISAALAAYRKHTGDEIRAALASEGISDGPALDKWMAWIGYLIRAEQRGGFRVH